MTRVCCYFQVHQPYRLAPCGPFAADDLLARANPADIFDAEQNARILRKVADKCYLPANRKLLDLIRRHDGRFRISFSISGVAIEQMQEYAPEVLESFQQLTATGCVEILGETYYHSLAALWDPEEFTAQVRQHSAVVQRLFGQTPRTFRNTELIYSDAVGRLVHSLGFRSILAEGADDILEWRSPNHLYGHPDCDLALLLKNYRLSDDIAFRFSNQGWGEYPLTSDKFARWLHAHNGSAELVNLFMDYETFGEHQWESTGIFDFLDHFPAAVLGDPDWSFTTPSELVSRVPIRGGLSFPRTVSWADVERDLTAWLGNPLQDRAAATLRDLGERIRHRNNPALLELWRRLQTSDHLYYMCTKWFADGDVHAYFSPYESPYEAFANFMSATERLERIVAPTPVLA